MNVEEGRAAPVKSKRSIRRVRSHLVMSRNTNSMDDEMCTRQEGRGSEIDSCRNPARGLEYEREEVVDVGEGIMEVAAPASSKHSAKEVK